VLYSIRDVFLLNFTINILKYGWDENISLIGGVRSNPCTSFTLDSGNIPNVNSLNLGTHKTQSKYHYSGLAQGVFFLWGLMVGVEGGVIYPTFGKASIKNWIIL